MLPQATEFPTFPFAARRILRRYGRRFRRYLVTEVEKTLAEKQGVTFTQDDYNACVARASLCIFTGIHEGWPRPDFAGMTEAMEDVRSGKARPIQEFIDEMRGRDSGERRTED